MVLVQRPLSSSVLKSVNPKEMKELPRSGGVLPDVGVTPEA